MVCNVNKGKMKIMVYNDTQNMVKIKQSKPIASLELKAGPVIYLPAYLVDMNRNNTVMHICPCTAGNIPEEYAYKLHDDSTTLISSLFDIDDKCLKMIDEELIVDQIELTNNTLTDQEKDQMRTLLTEERKV